MKKIITHWCHAAMTLVLTVITGGILLPLVRSYPKSVHSFILGLHDWQQYSFILFLCVMFTFTMFKLFSPRLEHFRHTITHPPAWLAFLMGVLLVALWDIFIGLDSQQGHQATFLEWLMYAGGSIVLVGLHWGGLEKIISLISPKAEEPVPEQPRLNTQNITDADWEDIEKWLKSDAIAGYDFLGNRAVAKRLARKLNDGTCSIGIVGPFGAGKSTLVDWVIQKINTTDTKSLHFLVCQHSCWGFENSSFAIQKMLSDAIKIVGERIDTFHVDSLPDSYRQTFSAGGEWIGTISNLILGKRTPSEQFAALSNLLDKLNAKLLFVVEDLDRNNSRSFDIQEVLAFLQQLKDHKNLSFVLTGGLSSTREIDFVKLCDHVEFTRALKPKHVTQLVTRICDRCQDTTIFPHFRSGTSNQSYEWNEYSGLFVNDMEEISYIHAVVLLLNTPRFLRHTLERTYTCWAITLHGEIDLNQLLAINILRTAAPESLLFLNRHWRRLHSPCESDSNSNQERHNNVRQSIITDWEDTIRNVEWNPTAALRVMKFILPATESWLSNTSSRPSTSWNEMGSVEHERYWHRAINEAIDLEEIKDQDVIRDILDWIETPCVEAELISILTTSPT